MKFLVCSISLILILTTFVTAENTVPAHPIDGNSIREWLLLGPFPSGDLDKDFLANVGGEANANPKPGDTVTTADGRALMWRRFRSEGKTINLVEAVGEFEDVTAYVFCILQSEHAGNGTIYLRADNGGVRVWLNGKRVYHNPSPNGLYQAEQMFDVQLHAGANRCLVKLPRYKGRWGITMRAHPPAYGPVFGTATDEAGVPIPGAFIRLEERGVEISHTLTNGTGNYRFSIYPISGRYDLSGVAGEKGDWQRDISLRPGERRRMNLTLRTSVLSGRLLTLDGKTPHVAVPVEAVRIGKYANEQMSRWRANQGNGRMEGSRAGPILGRARLARSKGREGRDPVPTVIFTFHDRSER
ncbi:carboxypeptidase regulatory-like domain-containing protein [Candidatus Poribacteria bacterium]|nr:carboxypeptidase regulatory-like domain-containing protein [Candidatus Poribacteria bacterium]